MVGGTRESVNRYLRNWQRNGIVQITDGSIIITNRPLLKIGRSQPDDRTACRGLGKERWARLFEQPFRVDKWSVCRG